MKPVPHLLSIATLAASCLHAAADEPARLAKASAEMAEAAQAFLTALDDTQRETASFPFEAEERENWHFVPRDRNGLPYADMSEDQRALARALLASGMSEKGLLKVETIIALESILAEMENNPVRRDPLKYYTTIFGEPAAEGTWGWRFEGHHLSVNFTLAGGTEIAAAPSFLGANPAEVRGERMRGTRPLAAEEDLARTLATALHEAELGVVFTDQPPDDVLTGNQRQATQLEPVGVLAKDMTEAQREGLLELISEYAHRFRREIAEKDLEKVRADFDEVRFGWAGGLALGEAYYYRVQGKTFLIEAANVQNQANHIHSVWRDLEGDFGRDILGEHHRHHLEHGHHH